jgi:hypothetical protein
LRARGDLGPNGDSAEKVQGKKEKENSSRPVFGIPLNLILVSKYTENDHLPTYSKTYCDELMAIYLSTLL